MARFRKIDVRTWGDEKFRSLSPLLPSGQALWLWLLTNPDTTSIPGLFRSGEAGQAEALGWSLKAFREAFQEVFLKGMAKADWQSRVVWVPNAINYNEPESPNVVKSWQTSWDEIPECQLKMEAYTRLKSFLDNKGEAFGKAFGKACRKPSWKVPMDYTEVCCATPTPNQEQEQEQEQDIISAKPTTRDKSPRCRTPRDDLFDAVSEITGSDPQTSGSHIGRIVTDLLKAKPPYSAEEVRRLPDILAKQNWNFPVTLGVVGKYIGWVRHPPKKPENGKVDLVDPLFGLHDIGDEDESS